MKNTIRLDRRALLAATVVAVISAPFAGSQAMAQDLTRLTFVQEWPVPNGFWIPWIIGADKGFYAEEGIELDVVTPPTVADTMKFLGTGTAQVAFTTGMDIIFAKKEEAPVVAIARYGRGNNWGILTAAGEPLAMADIKGKTVGIYNDAWTVAQLTMMLADVGLTMADITTVAATDDTVPLLLQKRVDAITGITNAEGTGMAVNGGQPAEFVAATDHGVPNTPIFMLAANTDWLAEKPDMARAFLRATRKSLDYSLANPEEAIAAFANRYAKAYDPAFITQQWLDTIPLFGEASADLMQNDEADWSRLLAALTEFEVIDDALPAADYFTNAYLPE